MQLYRKVEAAGIVIFVHIFVIVYTYLFVLFGRSVDICNSLLTFQNIPYTIRQNSDYNIYLVTLYSRCMTCFQHHPLICSLRADL